MYHYVIVDYTDMGKNYRESWRFNSQEEAESWADKASRRFYVGTRKPEGLTIVDFETMNPVSELLMDTPAFEGILG